MERCRFRVMKFGGTSVGSVDRLSRVLDIIVSERKAGPVAVVVSAMGHTTDHLIEAATLASKEDLPGAERVLDQMADLTIATGLTVFQRMESAGVVTGPRPQVTPIVRQMLTQLRQLLYGVSLLRERTAQTLDLVMSFGERLSASVVAELLRAAGVPAEFVDSREWVVTDDTFGNARVDLEHSRVRLHALADNWCNVLPVVTGFLGQTADGRTTTLGRNGSDYTATLLARWLDADEVNIWTDVSGVMTADPGLVSDAYPLSRLSYREALELVDFGASMFHSRTMIPLIESGIPMRIRNTLHPDAPGTLIDAAGAGDSGEATSVTSLENLALLGVRMRRVAKQASLGGRVLGALEAAGLTVWMSTLAAHGQAVAVAVPMRELERAQRVLGEELALEMERGEVEPVVERSPVTLLTLVAESMGRAHNPAGRFFGALGAVGIPVRAIAQGASSRSISCVVDAADTAVAVRTVHAAFNFAHQKVSLLVLGKGVVGSQLLAQVCEEGEKLARQHDVKLDVVGLVGSDVALFDPRGLDIFSWEQAVASQRGPKVTFERTVALLDELRKLPVPVLVDCTAQDGMEALYLEAFQRGIHVVAANKKPLTIQWEQRQKMMALTRQKSRAYRYETTVGASLPVIETLKNLVRTGDRVLRIEGSFSGTLGYVSNELMRGVSASHAVRKAKELGYTEPNPADDLSGMDVARKALILARELGFAAEMEHLEVKPLIDLSAGSPLLECCPELRDDGPLSVEEFFKRLELADPAISKWVESLKEQGLTLRYVARIMNDSEAGEQGARLQVGPVGVPLDHPASRLRGTEAFVAFTTERYRDYPLLVQGSGAGGAVTAAGVLADILAISQTLRGN